MDSRSVGICIAKLRKQNKMTQAELGEMLGVSDKAVSKWESGQGYPDIRYMPMLAEIFGVTIDHLMVGEEKGITVAGNIIIDVVKNIEVYPERGMLSNIYDIEYAAGGCVCNTAIDLARIDPRIPVSAVGKVGTDENGRYMIAEMQKHGINVSKISFTSESPTSFSDVMSIPSGERTFFHKRGANAEFSPEDIDISSLNCEILHIGYILLLDKFDAADKQYGTVMARFLDEVRGQGIKTSIDVVSDSSGKFAEKVRPALKYCDYVIINELECCGIWELEAVTADGRPNVENIRLAMEKTMSAGVKEKVIVHCKEACFCLDAKGRFTQVASVNMPKEDIKGTVGAGDAFCAGCLYGIYNGYTDKQILEFASASAACSLLEANATDGMKERNEIIKLAKKYGRATLRKDKE